MMKIFFVLFLFLSLSKQVLANDLIGEYFWASYKKQSNDYEERIVEMNKLSQIAPTLIYKVNNIFVELNDCFDASCSTGSPVIKNYAEVHGSICEFKEIIARKIVYECDDSDYFIKSCSSKVSNEKFSLYLNPVEEKDIKHLNTYRDEFSIIKELRLYDISAEYDEIPVKKVVTEILIYHPITLKISFKLNKGNSIVVRKNKKIKNQYYMAGTGMGVTGLIKISDFKKNLE